MAAAAPEGRQPMAAHRRPNDRPAGPRRGPRLAHPEQLPHQQRQVVGRYLYHVPLGYLGQPPQPRPTPAPCLAHVGEAPLHQLTPLLLQALTPCPLGPPPI